MDFEPSQRCNEFKERLGAFMGDARKGLLKILRTTHLRRPNL